MDSGGIELWGGIECSVTRIGDTFIDQVRRTGHHERPDDIERIAELGIKKLRYPFLWERIAPNGVREADWSWTDERLERLHAVGVEPIATLVHHGSGPPHTSLLDRDFPAKLAEFAGAVAKRYPQLRYFTPINEPLTTARFGALYGFWYPHERSPKSFVRAVLNEVRGTVLAMEAIRAHNPDAILIQTEDLGKAYGTAELAYQVEFDNARRWFTYDLLSGTLLRNDVFCAYLDRLDLLSSLDLERYVCSPYIQGLNYYVGSERHLDHRLELFPERSAGGNEFERYADVEAVRTRNTGITGLRGLGLECVERYGMPIAITEAHLKCTREEQVRWLEYLYGDAVELKAAGADVRGFAVWSLLGAYDWDSLMREDRGHYESGAFDVRFGNPRPTAVATWLREKTGLERVEPAILTPDGWWKRPERILYPDPCKQDAPPPADGASVQERIVIVGHGSLSEAFAEACTTRNLRHARIGSRLAHRDIQRALNDAHAWLAIDLDWDNGRALARACGSANVRLAVVSSDAVFGRARARAYLESDEPCPANSHGFALLARETAALMFTRAPLIVRSGLLFGVPHGGDALASTVAIWKATGRVPDDGVRFSLTSCQDYVQWVLDLAVDGERDIWHVAHAEGARWPEVIAALFEDDAATRFSRTSNRPDREKRTISSERGNFMPSLAEALQTWRAQAGEEATAT